MAEKMICTSCNVNLLGDDRFVKFLCPTCGKEMIHRCSKCKRLSTEYVCKSCGFVGP
ncbi:MAG: DUF1610 domain-containing protein [Candidatus Aenigmarchaeota archaeon]|nr:DUF1610 domain-containing protein [Candidatus Aenigmarchaeota archaeon]